METRAHNSRRYESISKVSTGFVREIEELDKALERQGYSVEISLYDAGLAEFWMNDGECQIVIRSRDDAERYEIIAWHFPKNSRYDRLETEQACERVQKSSTRTILTVSVPNIRLIKTSKPLREILSQGLFISGM